MMMMIMMGHKCKRETRGVSRGWKEEGEDNMYEEDYSTVHINMYIYI
jgi:hypothetical protein